MLMHTESDMFSYSFVKLMSVEAGTNSIYQSDRLLAWKCYIICYELIMKF